MAALPSDINFCYLAGHFVAAVIDGLDADDKPDGQSFGTLNVKVRALPKDLPVTHRGADLEIVLADIDTLTNEDSRITDLQGNPWIAFVAPSPTLAPKGSAAGEPWKVTVTVSGTSFPTRSKTFVPLPSSPEEPLQWTDIIEVAPSTPAELEALQQVLAEVAAGRAGAEAARDEARVARDEALVAVEEASQVVEIALNSQSLDQSVAALDMRAPRTVVVAIAGDSTANYPGYYAPPDQEWYETAWRELFASLWPDRPARLYRWDKNTTGFFAGPTVWQDGATPDVPAVVDPNAFVGRDTFTRTSTDVVGTVGEVAAAAWAGSAGAWAVNGSRLVKVNGTAAANAAFNLKARETMDLSLSCTLRLATNTSGSKSTLITLMRISQTARIYYNIVGTSAPTITLVVQGAGSSRTVETMAGTVIPTQGPTDYQVSFTLVGDQATATINGHVSTFTMTPTELGALAGAGSFWVQSTDADIQLDNVEIRGQITTPAQPGGPSSLPYATVYNSASPNTILDYQSQYLDLMYPVRPDVLFLSEGHNYLQAVTPSQFLAAVQSFVDLFHVKYPGVPVVIVSQNPRVGTATRIPEHAARQVALRGYAKGKGWGYVGGFEAFAKRVDGGLSLVPDGTHPNSSSNPADVTGHRIMADSAKAYIRELSARP